MIPKKYEHINFIPLQTVANNATRGLELRKNAPDSNKGGFTNKEASEHGIGSGVQRAINLKNRNKLSPDTIKRMHSFFSRHEQNKDTEKGRQSWLMWGGDAGWAWAKKIISQMEKADNKAKLESFIDSLNINDKLLLESIKESISELF